MDTLSKENNKPERFTGFDWIILVGSILVIAIGISSFVENIILALLGAEGENAISAFAGLIWLAIGVAALRSKGAKLKRLKSQRAYKSLVRIVVLVSIGFFLFPTLSFYLAYRNGQAAAQLTPAQQEFVDTFTAQGVALQGANDQVRDDAVAFLTTLNNADSAGLKEASKNLVLSATSLGVILDDIESYLTKNVNVFDDPAQIKATSVLVEVFSFRAEYNNKLIKLAELGTEIDFDNAEQGAAFLRLSDELSEIEKRLPAMQEKYLSAVAEFDLDFKNQLEAQINARKQENADLLEKIND